MIGGKLKRSAGMGLVTLILLSSSLAASSCGKEEGGEVPMPSGNREMQIEVEDRSDMDSLLQELDRTMESVSPEDFSDSQLGESELGL